MSSPGPTHRGAVTFYNQELCSLLTPGYFEIQNFALCDTFWFQCLSPTSVCAPKPGPCRKGRPSRCGWVTPSNCYQVGMVWLLQRIGGDGVGGGAEGCQL